VNVYHSFVSIILAPCLRGGVELLSHLFYNPNHRITLSQDPRCWTQGPVSRIQAPESRIQGPGRWIQDGPIHRTNICPYAQIWTHTGHQYASMCTHMYKYTPKSHFNIYFLKIFKCPYEHIPCVKSDHTAIQGRKFTDLGGGLFYCILFTILYMIQGSGFMVPPPKGRGGVDSFSN